MKTVFTGWRTVTPGACYTCGSNDDWDCDGRGTIYCGCQRCPDCQVFDGHTMLCPTLDYDDSEDATDAAEYNDYHART